MVDHPVTRKVVQTTEHMNYGDQSHACIHNIIVYYYSLNFKCFIYLNSTSVYDIPYFYQAAVAI